MSIRDKYAFAGVGLTRLGKIPEMTPDELAAQAITLALEDAGMRPDEVDGYIYQGGIGGGCSAFGSMGSSRGRRSWTLCRVIFQTL